MSATQWPSRVVPAQLSFLAIYNPALGPTDDTFRDQLVFYYSRAVREARVTAKKSGRSEKAEQDALREEENERLRQIGLAQGMVDFARSFSNDEPVDSVETDKSRIVLHEVEKGWWILASVDLTRLPSLSSSESTKKSNEKVEEKPGIEYSAREVSPPELLVQQLLQAHSIFCLHHGPSLDDLYVRLTRDKFCGTLERFWARFARSWDVLLHGNPAGDVFSGLKLANGGELGYGVGEEEWGSGERAVLEDLTHRTEGLLDVVVSRFGEQAPTEEDKSVPENETLPWMGSGNQPVATDGVIFGGVGAMERRSLRDISLWMRQIYTYGDLAYGVQDNPLRERRKRRRQNPANQGRPANGKIDKRRSTRSNKMSANFLSSSHEEQDGEHDEDTEIQAVQHDLADDTATTEEAQTQTGGSPANIPPPIVSAAKESLNKATRQAEREQAETGDNEDSTTTLGIPDQYMKYLTFGLSTFGKPAPKKRPPASRQTSNASLKEQQTQNKESNGKNFFQTLLWADEDDTPILTQLEPMPEGETLKSKIATQKHQENKGYFVIGLTGDLDELPNDESSITNNDRSFNDSDGSRIVLRTVQVEIVPREANDTEDEMPTPRPSITDTDPLDGLTTNFRRLRVLIYVHRPFVYCFLFENRTSLLQYTKFYRDLHRNLTAVHRTLLSSTDPAKVAERIENSHATPAESETASVSSTNKLPSKGTNSAPIFDLLYDPRLLTLHTSIPNIPEPGTPAAEGIITSFMADTPTRPPWTRVDAINVHSQILNTLASVKRRRNEIERTSKTTRGWWVVWMRIPPSAPRLHHAEADDEESNAPSNAPVKETTSYSDEAPASEAQPHMHRVAFLVRKASESSPPSNNTSTSSRAMSSMFSNLGLGSREDEKTGRAGAGWGPGALAGGIGVDARKYVEGLLSLNR